MLKKTLIVNTTLVVQDVIIFGYFNFFWLHHTCSAGEVRKVEPSVAAVLPSSSEPAAEAVVSL